MPLLIGADMLVDGWYCCLEMFCFILDLLGKRIRSTRSGKHADQDCNIFMPGNICYLFGALGVYKRWSALGQTHQMKLPLQRGRGKEVQ